MMKSGLFLKTVGRLWDFDENAFGLEVYFS
jgi:hypothetical protein